MPRPPRKIDESDPTALESSKKVIIGTE